jgi:outer membrane protein OmpA-like peptidoglycan-associated protein
MSRIPLFAVAIATAALSLPASADRPHRSYHYAPRHYGGWAYVHPRYYSYLYPAPIFGLGFAPAPYYYAPPAYVERPPTYFEDAPPPSARPREYRERSYAQIDPGLKPPAPAAPAPQAPERVFDRITLSATELFGFDEATLRAPQPRLDEIARALVENPHVGQVTITGYTDRLGSEAYNLELSQRRADAVKQYLVGEGVAPERLNSIGRGEADAVVECDDADRAALIRCLEPNRRVEVERITVERAVAPEPR